MFRTLALAVGLALTAVATPVAADDVYIGKKRIRGVVAKTENGFVHVNPYNSRIPRMERGVERYPAAKLTKVVPPRDPAATYLRRLHELCPPGGKRTAATGKQIVFVGPSNEPDWRVALGEILDKMEAKGCRRLASAGFDEPRLAAAMEAAPLPFTASAYGDVPLADCSGQARGKLLSSVVRRLDEGWLHHGAVIEDAVAGEDVNGRRRGQNMAAYGQLLQAHAAGELPAEHTDPEHIEYYALEPEHLAEQIVYAIDQPWGVDIGDITVRASGDGYIL